jgi:hypothetical protein
MIVGDVMRNNKFDLTGWHKLGIYFGLFLIIVGGLMYLPDLAHYQINKAHFAKTKGSAVWLEHDNNMRRTQYYGECRQMPKLVGDAPETCAGEAFSLFPDRNWKLVAEENMKKGL